jgi:hypothetical protein
MLYLGGARMSARSLLARLSVLSLTLSTVLLLAGSATAAPKKPQRGNSGGDAATMNIYNQAIDEQNVDAFYGTNSGYCTGDPAAVDLAYFRGDGIVSGPSVAYDFGFPWGPVSDLSTTFVDGADCNSSTAVCLGVQFNHNNTVLSLDTRGTLGPRKIDINFSAPCYSCALPGNPSMFGRSARMPALISVFMDNPFPSMDICSSRTCPEAQPAFVKLWFDDPGGDPLLTWRVDWPYVRVLRMSSNTWYVLGNGCDGSWVAQLYRLHNNKHRQDVSFQGSYLIPFFLSGVQH